MASGSYLIPEETKGFHCRVLWEEERGAEWAHSAEKGIGVS